MAAVRDPRGCAWPLFSFFTKYSMEHLSLGFLHHMFNQQAVLDKEADG